MYYGPEIIIDSGVTIDGYEREEMGIILNIPLAATNAIGSIIGMVLIDHAGRRPLLLWTLPVAFFSLLIISLFMYFALYSDDLDMQRDARITLIVFLVVYLAAFSIGISTVAWAVNSEIYPIHLIGTAVALATATNWLTNFAVATTFPIVMETDPGKVYAFDILAGFSLLAFIFTYCLVPETANKKITENIRNIRKGKVTEKEE